MSSVTSDMSTPTGAPSVAQQGGRGRNNNRRGWHRGGRGANNSRSGNNGANRSGARGAPVRRGNSNFQGCEPSLQGHTYDYNGTRDPDGYIHTTNRKVVDQVHDALKKFYGRTQGRNESLQKYYAGMVAQVDAIKSMGIILCQDLVATEIAAANGREEVMGDDRQAATERAIAMAFVSGANGQYAEYHRHLRNCYLDRHDYYPKTIRDAYNVMKRRELNGALVIGDDRVAFVNYGASDGETARPPPRCFRCHERGHVIRNCPHPEGYVVPSQTVR